MVEHGLLDREVLAVTWDGTGYGPDGTAWGGEVLKARVDRYERVASLRPFPLPGNEKAIRQPRRVALGLLALTLGEDAVLADAGLLARLGLSRRDARTLLQMARRGVNTAWTSSVGRLFDAVAALLLGAGEVSHEGEAAAWLEAIADPTVTDAYELPLRPPGEGTGVGDPAVPRGDWRPMVEALLADMARGESPGGRLRPVPQHPGGVGRRRGGRRNRSGMSSSAAAVSRIASSRSAPSRPSGRPAPGSTAPARSRPGTAAWPRGNSRSP